MGLSLAGKTALVTGASRGIGAATALKLAALGCEVALNYRSKSARAEAVADEIRALGRVAVPLEADITVQADLQRMFGAVREQWQRLDILVLNASGGLEKGKADDYPMRLNLTAQLETAMAARPLMPADGRIVFVTSHWAHFFREQAVMPGYEAVAESKHAGEQALRRFAAESGVSLVVVSGDVIEGTITPRLLERKNPGLLEEHRARSGEPLPTVDEFAEVIARSAADRSLSRDATVFVGATSFAGATRPIS